MESAWKLTVLMLWLFLFFNGCSSEKRFISRLRNTQQHLQRQIDNLRTELKTELNMLREDIQMFFEGEDEKTTVLPEVVKNVKEKSYQEAGQDEGKAAPYVQRVMKAFGMEKKINLKLRNELSALKETMTREIENQKIAYERDVEKVSAKILNDIESLRENATSVILMETTNIEKRFSNLYKEVKNSIKMSDSYQKEGFDNITALIIANVETSKSEVNKRIQKLRESMQDDINEHCMIPLASTNVSLNSTQFVIKDMSAKVNDALFRTFILACNQGIETGLYGIYLQDTDETIQLDCHKTTNGSAWARIYKWDYRAVSDYKDEEEYRKGFGRFGDNYWLGFQHLSTLTINKGFEMRIEMKRFSIKEYVGTFEDFKVVKDGRNYRVYFGKFSGSLRHKYCFESDVVPALFGNAMREKDWIPLTNCFLRFRSSLFPWYSRCELDGCVSDVRTVEIFIR